jgi:hypothetical protein
MLFSAGLHPQCTYVYVSSKNIIQKLRPQKNRPDSLHLEPRCVSPWVNYAGGGGCRLGVVDSLLLFIMGLYSSWLCNNVLLGHCRFTSRFKQNLLVKYMYKRTYKTSTCYCFYIVTNIQFQVNMRWSFHYMKNKKNHIYLTTFFSRGCLKRKARKLLKL